MSSTIDSLTTRIDNLLYDTARRGKTSILHVISIGGSIGTGFGLGDLYHELVAEIGRDAAEAFIRTRADHYLHL